MRQQDDEGICRSFSWFLDFLKKQYPCLPFLAFCVEEAVLQKMDNRRNSDLQPQTGYLPVDHLAPVLYMGYFLPLHGLDRP